MEAENLKFMLQMGTSGALLVVLYNLWGEFKSQNLFIRQMLMEAKIDREELAQLQIKLSGKTRETNPITIRREEAERGQ